MMYDDIAPIAGGDFISYGNYRKFKKGFDFEILTDDGNLSVTWNDNIAVCFSEYFDIWDNTREFGLPKAQGWSAELPWLIDYIKFMNRVYNSVENWRFDERSRKG